MYENNFTKVAPLVPFFLNCKQYIEKYTCLSNETECIYNLILILFYFIDKYFCMAKLYFRYGAMNSGKTTAIMQVAYNYEERNMHVLLIKPIIDTKWQSAIISRLGLERKVDIQLQRQDNVEDILQKYIDDHWQIDCILIDEVQFLTPSQIDAFYRVAVLKNIPVICYGLRTDFLLQSFPASERLLALAHTLEELKTICRCGKKAVCNIRLQDGVPVFTGEQIAIDGEEVSYEAVCGSCYAHYKKTPAEYK